MKRVTASEARKSWFRLLDEVAAGEVVVIERKGRRIVLRGESPLPADSDLPDYGGLLLASGADRADEWRWEWKGPGHDLEPETEAP